MAQINGKEYPIEAGTTVAQLLERLEIRSPRIAVEVNLAVVPKAQFRDKQLQPNDRVEIVSFVGGG